MEIIVFQGTKLVFFRALVDQEEKALARVVTGETRMEAARLFAQTFLTRFPLAFPIMTLR